MEVIILAGGLGTRLHSVIKDIPKAMAPINGIPFLEYTLNDLNCQNITKVILATGYRKECIRNYFGDSFRNIRLIYSEEETLLGTGGAIKLAFQKCQNNDVLIINGDIFTKINLNDVMKFHMENKNKVTMVIKKMQGFDRYGSVQIENGRITGFAEKEFTEDGYMSVGCYILKKEVLCSFTDNTKFSIEKDYFSKYIEKDKMIPYFYKGPFLDIGIPKDYEIAQKMIK